MFELTGTQANGTERETARREKTMREHRKKFIFPDSCCSLAKDVGKVVTKLGKLQNKITFPPTSSAARLNRDQKCATPLNYGKQWCKHAGGAL